MRLLHLFARDNQVARGYQRAGFHVIGVHPHEQPGYSGDEFHCHDIRLAKFWATFPGPFDAIHVSVHDGGELTEQIISDLRVALNLTGAVYVIEGLGYESNLPLLAPEPSPAATEFLGRQIRRYIRARAVEVRDEPA